MSQRINGQVNLRALAFLMPIKPSPTAAFRSGLECPAVRYRRARVGIPIQRQADNRPQTIEELPQRVSSLRGVLVHQCQVRHTKIPFFAADIARMTFSFCCHPQLNAGLYKQSTDFSFKKLITGCSSNQWAILAEPEIGFSLWTFTLRPL